MSAISDRERAEGFLVREVVLSREDSRDVAKLAALLGEVREECAKVALREADDSAEMGIDDAALSCRHVAAAIRSLSSKAPS